MGIIWSSPLLYRLLRLALGGVFLFSGLSKLADLAYFAGVINAFGILPGPLTYPAGVAIVSAEIILGSGLVLDQRGSLGGILILLLGFMAVAGYALYMGYDIDCGCFGASDPEATAFSGLRTVLVRDAVMVGVIAFLYVWRYKTGTVPAVFFKSGIKPEK